jgi:hypothetical protein
VAEGTATDHDGRRWDVAISNATEARQQSEKRRADRKEQEQAERLEADRKAVCEAMAGMPERTGTKTDIKTASAIHESRFRPAFASLVRDKAIIQTTITKGNNREYEAYQLATE